MERYRCRPLHVDADGSRAAQAVVAAYELLREVAQVSQQTVPVYFDSVGHTEAVNTVDLCAWVEGFLIPGRAFQGVKTAC
jgi:hypothetical protein